jgi:hypothetical protein
MMIYTLICYSQSYFFIPNNHLKFFPKYSTVDVRKYALFRYAGFMSISNTWSRYNVVLIYRYQLIFVVCILSVDIVRRSIRFFVFFQSWVSTPLFVFHWVATHMPLFSHGGEYEVQICLLGCTALMMEAARTSETSVDNYFTRQYIPEDKS